MERRTQAVYARAEGRRSGEKKVEAEKGEGRFLERPRHATRAPTGVGSSGSVGKQVDAAGA